MKKTFQISGYHFNNFHNRNLTFQRLFIGFWLVIFLIPGLMAQEYSTSSTRAIKYYNEGNRQNNLRNFDEAETNLLKAVNIDNGFLESYMLLGDVYVASGKYQKAVEVYQKVIKINDEKYPEVYFFCGLAFYKLMDYQQVIQNLGTFLFKSTKNAGRVKKANYLINCSRFALEAKKNPVPFNPVNLGETVNTPNDEYINAVRSDGLVLYFTGRENGKNQASGGDDFYFSLRTDVTLPWERSQKLGSPINTPGDEGALTITPDGRYLLFAGCHWPDGQGSCDIYAARISGSIIETPVNMGPILNTSKWESQPSLSTDGRTLYFSGIRPGGFGNSDLWTSYLQDNGEWSIPQNLSDNINTEGSEMAPFIHPDGQTLYFSSDSHIGMGGMDLYFSRKDSTGQWNRPVNLGFPINTPGEEINIIVNAEGNKAFISADKFESLGGFDIFEFELHPSARPISSTYLKGFVFDAKTRLPLEAFFSLTDLETGIEIVRSFSDNVSGEFLVCIPANRNYALSVSKEKYLFHSENFTLAGSSGQISPFQLNIGLNPLIAGETMILRNVFFENDQYFLKEESKIELNKLLEVLKNNPGMKIEISGHTDNVGSEDYNYKLSGNRAKSVLDFLVENGISSSRLTFKGFGFSKPIAENSTEEGRAKNRRTEIKILDISR